MARLLVSIAVLFVIAVTFAFAAPSAADIKKMKIKELKNFLELRGLQCKNCQEKSEFVQMALDNINTPVLGGGSSGSSSGSAPTKRPIPEGAFWEVWSNIAKGMCKAAATKEGLDDATSDPICNTIASAVETVFMRQGKRTAAQLKKKPDALLKTSHLDTYYPAGKRHLARVVGHCLKAANRKTCASLSDLQPLLEQDNKIKGVQLIAYLTNVGIENTNPMYEILKEKAVPHEEL